MNCLIASRASLFLVCLAIATATLGCSRLYPIKISGRVTDALTGDPIPGVVVGIKGSAEGVTPVVTNWDGRFSLPMVATGLEFSGRAPDWKLVFNSTTHKNTNSQIDFSLLSNDPESIDAVIVMQSMIRRDTPAAAPANGT
ncbi:hypothetical protein C5Y96_21725 [Blastopirellula marina]|uniref:Carboxypeptidase regulatory-like domain-containing protein n=1 Tax=Blastopirellula marina TaxID=124 RepID=A0A2S8F1L9_9BACT|nr:MULTISPECIES: carboxypeptidase regulatory-like domain-containing protein [Pirellulaceae]PQO26072.1 hypothetical protein C5Y96_21725 [Blastopirellula marina]RCS44430.1 carboxypeptidase-like regulatory domain-containing protein [Bremerella cremea]